MNKMTGIALTQSLCSLSSNVKVICLSMHNEREYVDSALKAGAVGYILKNKAGGELRNALLAVEQGKTYLTKELTSAPKSDKPKLSKRQLQVLHLLVKGMKAKDIGEHLFISHRTVEFHKYAIMRILGANNSAELTRYAIKLGFVDDQ
ncbi:DNA-binding response regulator LuxR family [Vibrio maritimus]|uniref:DNA-binding response regulator LuxR family n=1 Tax=Vibrio maritimus TaxID=990268 RepID=A0A090SGU5_9VIBR|nr:DNA-binding response regulator LuxR family [Vibrio maritimus]